MPLSAYDVIKIPDEIKPDSADFAIIRIRTPALFTMASEFKTVKPSKFTYEVRTIVMV